MDDLMLGLIVCALPAATLLGLVALVVRAARPRGADSTARGLEQAVAALRGENVTLQARVSRLEQGLARLQASAAVAGAPAAIPALPVVEWPRWGARPVGDALALPSEEVRSPVPAPGAAADPAPSPGAPEGAPAEAPASAEGGGSDPAAGSETASPASPEAARAPAAPEPAAPPSEAAASSSPPAPRIDWEQWIGVRGAAALGASILVLAGIYFFEYSIEHGLITPAMRMVAGTLVGLTCVLASELRLRKTHTVLANWLAGAGVAILYVAFWAGRALYGLYPTWAAGGLLVATTGACVALATRHRSGAIAALGLCGGFVTPLALSTGTDRPIALFSYLLLLDAAMLWVAHRRRWPWMAAASLVATAVYQGGWLFARLDEPRLFLGVGILALFGALFSALPRLRVDGDEEDGPDDLLWSLVRAAGVGVALLFTVGLALRSDLGDSFGATALLLLLVGAGASAVGLRHRSPWLPSVAVVGGVGAILGWAVAHPSLDAGWIWRLVGLAAGQVLVFVVAAEVGRARGVRSGLAPAGLSVLATLAVAALAAPFLHQAGPWPWLALVSGVGVLASVVGREDGWRALPVGAAVLAALALGGMFAAGVGRDGQPGGVVYVALLLLAAALASAGATIGGPATRRAGDRAGGAFALTLLPLLALLRDPAAVPAWAFLAATLVLSVLVLLVAARHGRAAWMAAALAAVTLAQGVWVARVDAVGPTALVALAATALLFALFPVVAPARLRDQAWAWRTAALAGPAGLLALRHAYLEVLGPQTLGLLPVALAALSIGAAYAVRARGPSAAEARRAALVWLTATGAGFATLAIPMQLQNEWLTIGWALEALALTALWRRLDHAGLKYLALGLAGAVCVRLLANPYVLDYADRGLPVLNWIAYTYLVPTACLVGMWALLREVEPARRRGWERELLGPSIPVFSGLVAAGAIALGFAWINLAILDVFSPGPELVLPFDRLPARDLALSIAWAAYAVSLLALGMLRRSTALRATSLALVAVTSGKVFLYDLAHLADLYRVASLAGLAISLIVISLAYQRYVFRASKEAA